VQERIQGKSGQIGTVNCKFALECCKINDNDTKRTEFILNKKYPPTHKIKGNKTTE
jgi:hypothetical protein